MMAFLPPYATVPHNPHTTCHNPNAPPPVRTTDALLQDWDAVSAKGGNAIHTELGTNGGGSPLFQIGKAVRVIQPDVAEPIKK